MNETKKRWRENNPEKIKEIYERYCRNNPEKIKKTYRKSHLKCLYDLSCEDWLKIWESQDGKCAICGKTFVKQSDAHVDHNHKTGKVRSLLCNKCNMGMGCFNDDSELTAKVTKYLNKMEIES